MSTDEKRQETRRTVNPIQVQRFLDGLDYPVPKKELLAKAKNAGADAAVMAALDRLPDQEYQSPIAVSREIGKLG